jgi:hypothetical protein
MTRAQQLVSRLLENEPDEVNPREYLGKVDFTKYARSYRLVNHGLMFSDYFSGHSASYTDWEDAATGYADDARAAVNEALEMLAENGWDLSLIEPQIQAEMAAWPEAEVREASVEKWIEDNTTEQQREEGDFETPSYIMSVDVSQAGEGYDPVTAQPT